MPTPTSATTRHGIPVRIVLRRPVAEILAGWKADAVRRQTQSAVRRPARRPKVKSAPVGG